jgi:hypothetical protein
MIYRSFLEMLKTRDLENFCKVMRTNSIGAASFFEDSSIDILHIDGNHTEESAMNDVKLFYPKVKIGGYILFDDVNWSTTKKAVDFLKETCEVIPQGNLDQFCMLFTRVR